MLIGLDASRANKTQKTGVEWYSYHLIQKLKEIPLKAGDKFILYSPSELRGELAELPDQWQNKVLTWPLKYLWTQIRLSLETLVDPPDLLFVSAHILPFLCPVKSVLVIHDLGFEELPEYYSSWQKVYYSWTHRYSFRKAAKIIVPSEFTKKEVIKLYRVAEDKIKVVPEGYNEEIFHLMDDRAKIAAVLNKYGVGGSYFLYVGRLEKKKNIKGLIEAYHQLVLSNIQPSIPSLVLVGKPGYGYREIRNRISKIKKIKEIGYIDKDDLVYLYSGALAFVYPSFYEGFGVPLLEAMACGCPVLASNRSSIPEVGGQAVLNFNPEDINDIVGAMQKIIDDRNLREGLKQKGLERVKLFSWQRCAQETMKILVALRR